MRFETNEDLGCFLKLILGVIVIVVLVVVSFVGSVQHGSIWWRAQKNPSALVDSLVTEAVSSLDRQGKWVAPDKGRAAYNRLDSAHAEYVVQSLVAHAGNAENRIQVLFLAVKLATPGSEEALVAALFQHGDKSMAEDYLNCGSTKLAEAGRKWAGDHGFSIKQGTGSHRVQWGKF